MPYLRAAWLLSQNGTVGDHLAQVYEREGKKQEAIHQYQVALATPFGNNDQIRERYKLLTGKNTDGADAPLLRRNSRGPNILSPGEELNRLRNWKLFTTPHVSGSALFDVVFSPGKIEDVRYVSGKESFKSMTARLSEVNFVVQFPDADPVRIVRRGILMCGTTGCDFTFLLPDGVHAVTLEENTSPN